MVVLNECRRGGNGKLADGFVYGIVGEVVVDLIEQIADSQEEEWLVVIGAFCGLFFRGDFRA
ncbi:MAG: hypothetical protein U9N40_09140 [Euryarchaeota archaeon]|nr:hypothetical protein [Euryarchaeota archaeon]